jgi:16S rRNA (guanine966-N2)-methyltransferase
MRIIAGRFKGRVLVGFKAEHIRPTTDRVKESLFNILQHELDGARVLDLFSGTGNLSIEALSRGAGYVESVESHKTSLKIISENLKKLNIEREVKVIPTDVFKYLKNYKGEPFSIIFVDPPFTQRLAHVCMESLCQSKVAAVGTKVVIESSRQERLEIQYAQFLRLDQRSFGDKTASFFKKVEP